MFDYKIYDTGVAFDSAHAPTICIVSMKIWVCGWSLSSVTIGIMHLQGKQQMPNPLKGCVSL